MRLFLVASLLLLAVCGTADAAPDAGGELATAASGDTWRKLAKLVVETIKSIQGDEPKVSRRRGSNIKKAPRQSLLDTELPARDCGKLPAKLSRISGGYTARMGEFPSFVRLNILNRYENDDTAGYTQCGGTLIGDYYVLTAAHCLKNINSTALDVVASTTIWAKGTPPGDSPLLKYKAKNWCISDKFDHKQPLHRYRHHDIAIITLDKPVQFTDYVQPACLPKRPSQGKKNLRAVGLGAIAFVEWQGKVLLPPKFPEKLQVLPVEVAPKCTDPLDEHPSKVCIDNVDPNYWGTQCIGDSGGGVYGLDPWNRHEGVATISYGYEACQKGIRGQPIDVDLYNVRDELEILLAKCMVKDAK